MIEQSKWTNLKYDDNPQFALCVIFLSPTWREGDKKGITGYTNHINKLQDTEPHTCKNNACTKIWKILLIYSWENYVHVKILFSINYFKKT